MGYEKDFPNTPVERKTEVSVFVAGKHLFSGHPDDAEEFIQKHALFAAQRKEHERVFGARWVIITENIGAFVAEYREYFSPHDWFLRERKDELGHYRIEAIVFAQGNVEIVLTHKRCYVYVAGRDEAIEIANGYDEFISVEVPDEIEQMGFGEL